MYIDIGIDKLKQFALHQVLYYSSAVFVIPGEYNHNHIMISTFCYTYPLILIVFNSLILVDYITKCTEKIVW